MVAKCSPQHSVTFPNQITAIINNRMIGTPDIHKVLVEASNVTISPKKHLVSHGKENSANFKQEVGELHPLESIKLHIFQLILKHRTNLPRLLRKNDQTQRRTCHRSDGLGVQRSNSVSFCPYLPNCFTILLGDVLGVQSPGLMCVTLFLVFSW